MAAQFSPADTDFFCSVCHGIFQNPVVLSCSHSFCKDCLKKWWKGKQRLVCPLCKVRSPTADPPCNLALKNLCESFFLELSLEEKASARSEALCSLHSEKLKLFCLDHQQPVCVVCLDSKAHTNHRFKPIDEAAEDCRKELRQHLKSLWDKVEHFTKVRVKWDQKAEHIKAQTQTTERQIQEEFKMLHKFLEVEKETRMAALRREGSLKYDFMKLKILTLSAQIDYLSDTIKATEQELKLGSVRFLQNYKAAAEKAKQRPLMDDQTLGPGALIDVSTHLGNLTFNIWIKMKEMVTYTPVILDPNTAEINLHVSENLKSVKYKEKQSLLPQNPERFEFYPTVLGSESFDLGTHSWDVDVRSNESWAVGVIGESVPRKVEILSGHWELWLHEGKYRAYAPPQTDTVLSVKKPPQRIRVELDWSKGKLSFTDLDTNAHIYTFSQTFTERVFPFFNLLSSNSLSILPQKVTVQVEI